MPSAINRDIFQYAVIEYGNNILSSSVKLEFYHFEKENDIDVVYGKRLSFFRKEFIRIPVSQIIKITEVYR